MSTENTVSISIDPSPLRTFVKAIISEELQPTLYTNDRFKAEVNHAVNMHIEDALENNYKMSRIVDRAIDYGELAGNIDMADLSGEISYRELASEIDIDDVANRIEIDMDSLAENIDYKKLAAALLEEMAVRVKN
jgi:hypothetical protein